MRTRKLGQRHRTMLLLVDGKRSRDQILELGQKAGAASSCFDELVELAMVDWPALAPAPAPPEAEAEPEAETEAETETETGAQLTASTPAATSALASQDRADAGADAQLTDGVPSERGSLHEAGTDSVASSGKAGRDTALALGATDGMTEQLPQPQSLAAPALPVASGSAPPQPLAEPAPRVPSGSAPAPALASLRPTFGLPVKEAAVPARAGNELRPPPLLPWPEVSQPTGRPAPVVAAAPPQRPPAPLAVAQQSAATREAHAPRRAAETVNPEERLLVEVRALLTHAIHDDGRVSGSLSALRIARAHRREQLVALIWDIEESGARARRSTESRASLAKARDLLGLGNTVVQGDTQSPTSGFA